MSSLFTSIGSHGCWGHSASFDMLQCLQESNICPTGEISILLISGGDIRHILETVAKIHKKNISGLTVRFYILEQSAELLCRHLALLYVYTDPELPIRQKANTFLEIYGNIKVQQRTSLYLESIAKDLIKTLVSTSTKTPKNPILSNILDISHLKYKDKDKMELFYKSYNSSNQVDIQTLYDYRLRGYYAERYDARAEISDWDYYHSLHNTAGSIIHIKQFKNWRISGIGYEFHDQLYTQPNWTMIAYTEGVMKNGKDKGMKKEVQGYWGDIVASPYYAFGLQTETPNKYAEGLYEIVNKDTGTEQHRHNTVEIALHTLFSYLWMIETGQPYTMTKANDIFSGLGLGEEVSELGDDILELLSSSSTTTAEISSSHENEVINQLDINMSKAFITSSTTNTNANCNKMKSTNSTNSISNTKNHSSISECSQEEKSNVLSHIEDVWKHIKVIPILGDIRTELSRQKYKQLFDFIYISNTQISTILQPLSSSDSTMSSSSSGSTTTTTTTTTTTGNSKNDSLLRHLCKQTTTSNVPSTSSITSNNLNDSAEHRNIDKKSDFHNTIQSKSCTIIAMETVKYLTHLTTKQKSDFNQNILIMTNKLNLTLISGEQLTCPGDASTTAQIFPKSGLF